MIDKKEMKLVCTNFRCYASRTFDISDQAITLLYGDSGKGKTSVFKAIHFALFGKEVRNITTFGQRKTKVELTYGDMTVIRTKGPNHLEVKTPHGTLEDAAAQAHIDSVFGVHFMQTCYMSQKCLDNFFSLSREARASLLRTLSIQTFDINALKNRIKLDSKDRKLALQTSSTEVTFIQNEMKSRNCKQVPCPTFPVKCKPGTPFEDAITEERKQCDHNAKKLQACTAKLRDANLKLQTAVSSAALLASTQQELDSLDNLLTTLENKLHMYETLSIKTIESEMQIAQACLTQAKLVQTITEMEEKMHKEESTFQATCKEKRDALRKRIQDLVQDRDLAQELEENQEEIDFCVRVKALWTKVQDCCKKHKRKCPFSSETFEDDVTAWLANTRLSSEDVHSQEDAVLTYRQTIATLETSIADLRKQLRSATHTCPGCKCTLALSGGMITLFDKANLQSTLDLCLTKLEKTQASYKLAMSALEEAKRDVSYITELRTLLEGSESSLDNDVDSIDDVIADDKEAIAGIKKLQATVAKMEAELASLDNAKSDVVSFLQSEIRKAKAKSNTKLVIDKTVDTYEQDLARCTLSYQAAQQSVAAMAECKLQKAQALAKRKACVEKLERIGEAVTQSETLREEIKTTEEEVTQRSAKAQRFQKTSDEIDRWRRDYALYTEWERYAGKLEDAKNRQEEASRAYACALRFEKIVNETEGDALQSFLDALNLEIDVHMQVMFGGAFSMVVTYGSEDEKGEEGKKKQYVDITIYRNAEEIPFESLSGGESDRCALVLFLAFNKLSHGKMLLLDECLSSLHAESVESIVDHIKLHFSDRITMMTLHQTTQGLFDEIIPI